MKALTFKQYKLIDLGLLSLLFVITETIVTVAGGKWFKGQPYSLSLAVFFFCLGLMRWSLHSWVFALVGGFVHCLASAVFMAEGVKAETFAIYCIGNLFMLLGVLVFKAFDREKIRTKPFFTVVFVTGVYLFTELGRFAVAFAFKRDVTLLSAFVFTDVLSGVFALILVLVIRKTEGLFEDQKTYLLRLEAEKEKDKETEQEFADRI